MAVPSRRDLFAIEREEANAQRLQDARERFRLATNELLAASELPESVFFELHTICMRVDLAVEKGGHLGPAEIARIQAGRRALATRSSMTKRYEYGVEIVREFAPRVLRAQGENAALTQTLRCLCALTENVDHRFLYDRRFMNGAVVFVKDLSVELGLMRSYAPQKPTKGQRSAVGILAALALQRGVWTEDVDDDLKQESRIAMLRNRIAAQLSKESGAPQPRKRRA